jgi:hypothetical protein
MRITSKGNQWEFPACPRQSTARLSCLYTDDLRAGLGSGGFALGKNAALPVRLTRDQSGRRSSALCIGAYSTNNNERAPEGPPARRMKTFRSVSRRSGRTEPAKAPVEGEQHALNIEVDVEVPPELVLLFVDEPMIVLEIVEIGEPVFGTER